MDDLIEMVQAPKFWATFAISGATLAWLRLMAGGELKNARLVWAASGRRTLEPPGTFGVSVAGTRILKWGGPGARFFNPRVFLELLIVEPTLLAWYVGGWLLILQQWTPALKWLGGALLWRLIWDVLTVRAPSGGPDIRSARCFVKCAWAASSGVFYACMTACFLAILFLVICLVGILAAALGSNRRRGWRS